MSKSRRETGQHETSDPAPSTGARINFEVGNVDDWWSRLSPDADVVEELMNTPYGSRRFTIRDLDGYEVGFVQASTSPASRP